MNVIVTHYKDLTRWDVKSFLYQEDFISSFPMYLLQDILKPYNNIEILENDKNYNLCGIHSCGKGIFHRDIKKGIEIKSNKLSKIEKGTFIYSRLGANNGAFDLVNDNFNGYYVTNEFPTFHINTKKIEPKYLRIVFLLQTLWQKVESMLQGAAHKRFKEEHLLDLKIPIPDIKTQQKIVNDFNKIQEQTEELKEQANKKEKQIDEFLMRELGIETIQHKKNKGAFTFYYKNLEQWGVGFNSWNWTLDDLFFSKKFKMRKISAIANINLNLNFLSDEKMKEVSFVPMELVSDKYGKITKTETRNFRDVHNGYTKFREGNIIFAKITPCMQNGKCAIAKNLTNKIGVGSTEFHVIEVNKNIVIAEFLWYILRSDILRQSAQRFFIGSAGQQRVPDYFLKNLKIPIPSIKTQKIIVAKIEKMRTESQKLRSQSIDIMQIAKKNLQNTIMGK